MDARHSSWSRWLLVLLLTLLVSGCLLVGGTVWAAQGSLPGDPLYAVKQLTEDGQRLLARSPRQRAELELRLATRRLEELQRCAPTSCGLKALANFDAALTETVLTMALLPPEEARPLRDQLTALAEEAAAWLGSDEAQGLDTLFRQNALTKVQTLAQVAAAPDTTTADLLEAAALDLGLPTEVAQSRPVPGIEPRPIPFPAEALKEHPFPLEGAHAEADCMACHSQGRYKGTPMACAACHLDPHQGAYGDTCERCHNTVTFRQVQMDHTGLTDCQSCHAGTAPPDHYPGQCSRCHTSTTDWGAVSFDHTGLTDCQSCHAGTAPPNHYPGQCSQCHVSTADWGAVSFDHTGLADCQGCHARPAGHFSGQCSQCHNTTSWSEATLANHSFPLDHGGAAGDCAACHPGGNYATYTCYTCHEQDKIAREHQEEGISDFGNCVRCHATGTEDEGDRGGEAGEIGGDENGSSGESSGEEGGGGEEEGGGDQDNGGGEEEEERDDD